MKIICTLITLIVFTSNVHSQDTIRSQDLPGVNTNFTMSIGQTFPGIDVIGTGPNHVWDFTQLGRTSQRIDSIIDPAATDQLLSFFFINIPINTNRANLAQKGVNFNLGTTGLSNVFNYYYNSQSSFEQPGFGAVVNGIPVPIAYTPHDIIYKFPLAYGDVDSVAYHWELDLTTAVGFFYSVDRTRHNEVDGWGTLSTPFGTFSALRVKSVVIERDSVYIDTFNTGVNLPPVTTIEYKWLSPGKGLPLLQINTSATNQIQQIIYQDSSHTIGVNEIPAIISNVTVFPNPASEKIFVKFNMMQKSNVAMTIVSSDGKEIFLRNEIGYSGENIFSIDLVAFNLSKGNYFLKITSAKSEIIKSIHIE